MTDAATITGKPGVSRILRVDAFPAGMVSALAAAGCTREDLLAALPADMLPSGSFADLWLVIARDRLVLLSGTLESGKFEAGLQEPFKGITGIDCRSVVGGAMVLVSRGEQRRELVRCTRVAERAIKAAIAKLKTHIGMDTPADPAKKDKPEEKAEKDKTPPPEALPRMGDDAAKKFVAQLDDLGEQRYCATCGLPLKRESAVCPICFDRGRTLRRVLSFATNYRRPMIVLFVLLVATILFRLAPPYIMGRMFDIALAPHEPREQVYRLWFLAGTVIAYLLSNVMAAALRIWAGRIAVTIGSAVSRDLRDTVFKHLQILSIGYFSRHKTGALMTRVNGDTQHLQGFLVDGVQYSLVSMLEVILITGVLFFLNWQLAILVILPAPLVILVTKRVWKKIMQMFRRYWEVLSRMSAVLNDSLRGVRVVKAFGGETQEITRFERASERWYRAALNAELFWITLMPMLSLIVGMGLYFVLLAGGFGLITGSTLFGVVTLGLIVQFTQYLPMLYAPLQLVTRLNEWLTRSMTAAERIFEILDTPAEIAENPKTMPLPAIKGCIEFKDVSFGYEKHTPVVKRMNLSIKAGEMIGLVGHSGAGKSTTINLVARLYDADEGIILIDGVPIRDIKIEDLRKQIGVVLQETFLFTGSVAENIAYGRPNASREDIIAAAKLANAHDFIMEKPDAYDSEVEESGNNFSSGEKQRLAIARAILHNPKILILDEATSSVDTKTEQQIQQALTRLTTGRTTIAIAHRLSTLRGAQRLVVMEKGEIKDVGSHEELANRPGIYQDLVKAQTEMSSVIAVGA